MPPAWMDWIVRCSRPRGRRSQALLALSAAQARHVAVLEGASCDPASCTGIGMAARVGVRQHVPFHPACSPL